jgi:hypothetical protein
LCRFFHRILIPAVYALNPPGLPGNPHREQVPAGAAPVQEIPAGTEIVFNIIGRGLALDYKKAQILFDPPGINRAWS